MVALLCRDCIFVVEKATDEMDFPNFDNGKFLTNLLGLLLVIVVCSAHHSRMA